MYKHQSWMKDTDHSDTYWGNNGTHQLASEFLTNEIPSMGKANNPVIEVLRNAVNFYYDRYNNGHCNPCRTKCAAPVRNFLRKYKAPKHLKFKINVTDSELEETMDWVIVKCYELFTGEEAKKVVVPKFGEVVEMNDGSWVGVINIPFEKDGYDFSFRGVCSTSDKMWYKGSEIKRVVPFEEIPSGN